MRTPSHHLSTELSEELSVSFKNLSSCEQRSKVITSLVARIVNDHSILHLHEIVQNNLVDSLKKLPVGCISSSKIAYILSVAAFSRGSISEVNIYCCTL